MNREQEYETVWDCFTHKYAARDFKALSYASRHTRDAHIATAKCTIKYSPRTEMPFGFAAFIVVLCLVESSFSTLVNCLLVKYCCSDGKPINI